MFRDLQRGFVALSLGWLASGCAGQLTKVGGTNDLPPDLPKDLQQKFEIREAALAPTAIKPVEPNAKKKKPKRVTKAEAKAAKEAALAFPNRRPPKEPIWVNESQQFDVTYLGMYAGKFTLTVEPHKMVASRKVYHVRGTAVSTSIFSLFYRLNDTIETFFDYEGFFSHRFHIVLDESKQSRDAIELNDSEKKQTYYWNRWNRSDGPYVETKEFFPIEPFSQDSLSALYYLRTVPLPDGGVVSFPVINEGKSWEAIINVVRREEISTPLGKMKAIVIQPDTKFQGVLKKNGDSFLWLSDDDRRFLLKVEAKVKVGTVIAKASKMELGTPPEQP